MKTYNESKTIILDYDKLDFEKGYIRNDTIIVPEQPYIERKTHYEVEREYPNGGKDMVEVVDVEGQDFIAEHTEEIQVYIEYTKEELENIELNNIRSQREFECFSIINRGQLWYNTLSDNQKVELQNWYNEWLDVTRTKKIPQKPSWIK